MVVGPMALAHAGTDEGFVELDDLLVADDVDELLIQGLRRLE